MTERSGEIQRHGARSDTRTARTRTARPRTRTARDVVTDTEATGTRQDGLFVVALIENRAREVGMAAYNLRALDMELRQFADNMSYTTTLSCLTVYSPIEILLSQSSANGSLHSALQRSSYLTDCKISFIARKYFNETVGSQVVELLSTEEDPRLTSSDAPKYLALASTAALRSYIEHAQSMSFAPHCLRIRLRVPDDSLFIDVATMSALELVSNARATTRAQPQLRKETLLGILDYTKTRSGRLFLRRTILEPPGNLPTIQLRQELIGECLANEDIYFQLVELLGRMPDIEAITSSLIHRQKKSQAEIVKEAPSMKLVRQILLLKRGVETAPRIVEAISHSTSPILGAVAETLKKPAFENLSQAINDVIDPEAVPVQNSEAMRLQAAFAIRPGVNGLLDVSRKLLSETIEDMHSLAERTRSELQSEKVSISFNVKRGYHLSVPASEESLIRDMEETPVQLVRKGRIIRFSTPTLVELNERYMESLQEIFILSDAELDRILEHIWSPDIISALGKFVDAVAILDACLALVTHITMSDVYTRPRITESGPIAVKQGRHPVLEKLLDKFVPNDCFLSDGSSLHVISGINMSGKTTYLKAIALLCILAHTGSWVPAEFASFRLLGAVSARISTCDNLEENASSFSQEMSETAVILDQVSSLSRGGSRHQLLVFDELGRSTSATDGFAIAWAVAEKLAASSNVLTLFASHYPSLSKLAILYPSVKCYHFSANVVDAPTAPTDRADENPIETVRIPQFDFTFELTEGSCHTAWYGLSIAAMAGFPTEFLAIAARVRSTITDNLVPELKVDDMGSSYRRACHEVYHRLILLKEANLDDESIRQHVEELQLRVDQRKDSSTST